MGNKESNYMKCQLNQVDIVDLNSVKQIIPRVVFR